MLTGVYRLSYLVNEAVVQGQTVAGRFDNMVEAGSSLAMQGAGVTGMRDRHNTDCLCSPLSHLLSLLVHLALVIVLVQPLLAIPGQALGGPQAPREHAGVHCVVGGQAGRWTGEACQQ